MTKFAYDAAGRLIREGDKSYTYAWLDKLVSVTEAGKVSANFSYHLNGQIAGVTYADGRRENYLWDGLALIHRDGTELLNEPAITGGNPVLSGDKVLFNDLLGNTLGVKDQSSYQPIKMTAFGESDNADAFFTGKPLVGELGYAFLFRNYRPKQGKWQTADPLGYPDGWNNFAYVNNGVIMKIDLYGTKEVVIFVSGAGEGTFHNAGEQAMNSVYGSGNYTMFDWTQESEVKDFINSVDDNDTITLIGHSYGGDTAENAAHDTTRAIDKLITLDPVSFWDFDGSKPDSVNNWYNVIAEDDVYTWNDWIADVGGQWGEEYGAQNFVVETDHNNPLDMLNYLKGRGLLE